MKTRALKQNEYMEIIKNMMFGFTYETLEGKKEFRPNYRIALILQVQATTGLRIGDILELKLNNFKNGKLRIKEQKTNKIQDREVAQRLIDLLTDYALENKIGKDEKLFPIGVRAVQKQLKIVSDYLGLKSISTHSFRKFYATVIYDKTLDINLIRSLLNHSSVETTQKYIGLTEAEINKASKEMDMLIS